MFFAPSMTLVFILTTFYFTGLHMNILYGGNYGLTSIYFGSTR
jgi:hypothetical protein